MVPVTTPAGRFVIPGTPGQGFPPSYLTDQARPLLSAFSSSSTFTQEQRAPPTPFESSFPPHQATGLVGTASTPSSAGGSGSGASELDRVREELAGLQEAYKAMWLELSEARGARAELQQALGEAYDVCRRTGTGNLRESELLFWGSSAWVRLPRLSGRCTWGFPSRPHEKLRGGGRSP